MDIVLAHPLQVSARIDVVLISTSTSSFVVNDGRLMADRVILSLSLSLSLFLSLSLSHSRTLRLSVSIRFHDGWSFIFRMTKGFYHELCFNSLSLQLWFQCCFFSNHHISTIEKYRLWNNNGKKRCDYVNGNFIILGRIVLTLKLIFDWYLRSSVIPAYVIFIISEINIIDFVQLLTQ